MHPTQLKLFRAWAKAMEEGATVKTPDYGKRSSRGTRRRGLSGANTLPRRKRQKRRKRRKRRNRRKEE